MSTLHYRRVRGDMIETYKILSGKYDTNVVPTLKTSGIQVQATRGNDLRIFKTRFKYDLRKFYYATLLPRRGPHIASHSVCPSVCLSVLSVCPSVPLLLASVTSRHLANYNDTHVLFGRAAYRTAISAAQILVLLTE